ncbi:MAG: hypothetical protein ABIR28_03165 [Vicinamibacteria bacterium]
MAAKKTTSKPTIKKKRLDGTASHRIDDLTSAAARHFKDAEEILGKKLDSQEKIALRSTCVGLTKIAEALSLISHALDRKK